MSWIVLVVSGVFESVWAIAMDRSEGFTKPVPVIVFLVALVLSMGGLSYAMRDIGVGTSYAVWVGIGATITVCYSMITGGGIVFVGQDAADSRTCRLCGRAEAGRLSR